MDFADRFPVSPVLKWAATRALDTSDWLSVDGASSEYISHSGLHRIFMHLEAAGFDESIGLEIGAMCGIESLGLYGQIGQHCTTLGEAAEIYMLHRELKATPRTHIDYVEAPDRFTILVSVPQTDAMMSSSNFRLAFAYAQTLNIFRSIFEDPSLSSTLVRFQSLDARYQSLYEAHFGAPVEFGCTACCIQFESSILTRPIPNAVPATRPFLEEMAIMRMEKEKSLGAVGSDFSQDLRQALRALILAGNVDSDALARRMNISTRTLQRRLTEKNLTFRRLADDVLKEMACQLLTNPDLSVQEIAFKLGYTQASSFTRAFKRWTGRSPSEVREDLIP